MSRLEELGRLESLLSRGDQCDTCDERIGLCPRCHRPVGPTPMAAERATADLRREMSRLHQKMVELGDLS